MPDNSNFPDERTPVPPSYSEFEEAMLEWADFMGERHGWFDFDPMQNFDFMAHTPTHIDPQLDRQEYPLNSPTAHAGRSSQVRERAGSTRALRRQHYPSSGHVPGQQSPGAQVTSPRSRNTARPALAAEHRDRYSAHNPSSGHPSQLIQNYIIVQSCPMRLERLQHPPNLQPNSGPLAAHQISASMAGLVHLA